MLRCLNSLCDVSLVLAILPRCRLTFIMADTRHLETHRSSCICLQMLSRIAALSRHMRSTQR